MFKYIALSAVFLGSATQAGDLLDGYFLIVGSTPSNIQVEEMVDVGTPAFRETVATLSAEWSDTCGVNVNVWHTNLMHNADTPWTADYWFAYIAQEASEAAAYTVAPETGCISESYVKYGEMVIPTLYQICTQPAEYPDIYETSCN